MCVCKACFHYSIKHSYYDIKQKMGAVNDLKIVKGCFEAGRLQTGRCQYSYCRCKSRQQKGWINLIWHTRPLHVSPIRPFSKAVQPACLAVSASRHNRVSSEAPTVWELIEGCKLPLLHLHANCGSICLPCLTVATGCTTRQHSAL